MVQAPEASDVLCWTIGGLRDLGFRGFGAHRTPLSFARIFAHDQDVPLDGVVFPGRPHRNGCVADFDAGHGELLQSHRLQPADARHGGTMHAARSFRVGLFVAFDKLWSVWLLVRA